MVLKMKEALPMIWKGTWISHSNYSYLL